MNLRTFFANMVCGTIPGKKRRDIVRIKIKYREYLRDCKKFALSHVDGKKHRIRIDVGARSHNLILLVGNVAAFKFPLHENGYEKATREKRIVDTFSKISPIKIPKLEVLQWGDITVRKYEFADGVLLKKIKPQIVMQYRNKISTQLAEFIFAIGNTDPVELRDLKLDPYDKPTYMHGWFHNDIAENFTVDPQTLDIKYFIDWEDTIFYDFTLGFMHTRNSWEKSGFVGLIDDVIDKYTALYKKSRKHD